MSIGKVLVVDDERCIRMSVKHMLINSDYEVIEAENGQEAIDVLKQEKDIDLVLLDVMMPLMDGKEALKLIKIIPHAPTVIMMTAANEYENECLKEGAMDYIVKPFHVQALLLRVANHVLVRRALDKKRVDGIIEMAIASCHHINQPLTVILGYADMLMKCQEIPEKQLGYVAKIKEAVGMLAELTSKMSIMTRARKVSTTKYFNDQSMVDFEQPIGELKS
jgi:CheY-like chemotaxis protein